jgi:hypothetical protein
MDYKNGKIYMIYPCVEGADEGDIYIGATTTKLSKRMADHRVTFCTSSRILFAKYGVENCKIELICDFPCLTRNELNKEEGRHIRQRKCVNKNIAGRTAKDRQQEESIKLAEISKKYRQENKEKVAEYQLKTKIHNNQQCREYYQINKQQIMIRKKEKIVCCCGCTVTKRYLSIHEKTKKHLERIAELIY